MDQFDMHALIKGRVQNVGFRATTYYFAKQLGLKGSVRNLTDGSVEIYAQGPKDLLEQLLQKLKTEPGLGHIEDIELQYVPATQTYEDFNILYSKT